MIASSLFLAISLAHGRHPVPEANKDNIPTGPCFPWSNPGLDGGVAAPVNHIVMLENQWVRVVEVTNPGGAKESYHTHARPSLFMQDMPASVQHWYADGSANTPDPNTPKALYYAPMTAESGNVYFMKPNDFHSVKNTDTKLFHSVRMELKGFNSSDPASFGYLSCPNVVCAPSLSSSSSSPAASVRLMSPYQAAARGSVERLVGASHASGVRLVLQNEAARVWDVTLPAGATTDPFQLTADVSVVVVDKLAGYSWIGVKDQRIARKSPAASSSEDDYYAPANVATNKVFFFPGSDAQPWVIKNTGTKDFHAIIAELVQSK